jgi:hypothetical protein
LGSLWRQTSWRSGRRSFKAGQLQAGNSKGVTQVVVPADKDVSHCGDQEERIAVLESTIKADLVAVKLSADRTKGLSDGLVKLLADRVRGIGCETGVSGGMGCEAGVRHPVGDDDVDEVTSKMDKLFTACGMTWARFSIRRARQT